MGDRKRKDMKGREEEEEREVRKRDGKGTNPFLEMGGDGVVELDHFLGENCRCWI